MKWKQKKWTEEEDLLLCKLLSTNTIEEITKLLGRRTNSVDNRIRKLGLKVIIHDKKRAHSFKPWTNSEIKKLYNMAGVIPIRKAAKKLGRTRAGIEYKCTDLGFKWRNGVITKTKISKILGITISMVSRHMDKLSMKDYISDPEDISKIANSILSDKRSINSCKPSIKHLERIAEGDFEY